MYVPTYVRTVHAVYQYVKSIKEFIRGVDMDVIGHTYVCMCMLVCCMRCDVCIFDLNGAVIDHVTSAMAMCYSNCQ